MLVDRNFLSLQICNLDATWYLNKCNYKCLYHSLGTNNYRALIGIIPWNWIFSGKYQSALGKFGSLNLLFSTQDHQLVIFMERFVFSWSQSCGLGRKFKQATLPQNTLFRKNKPLKCKGCQFISKCNSHKKILKITQAVETPCYQSAHQKSLILKKSKFSKRNGGCSKSHTLAARI